MSSIITGGTMAVGGVELHVTDLEGVGPETQTLDCQVPDPGWSHTDTNGHTHRWWVPADELHRGSDQAAQTPTLATSQQHVDCDGSCPNWDCEGYTITVWHCLVCGEQVEPRFRRGTTTITTRPGYWLVTTVSDTADDPPARAEGAAVLVYPSGPGQMMRMTGQAHQLNHTRQCHVAEPVRDVREFGFYPDKETP